MKNIKIGNESFSEKSKPFVIAEIGSNFDQSLEQAKKLITEAKKCGAKAVKFQLFNASRLYPNKYSKEYKLFKSIELKKNWIEKLKRFCNKKKILFSLSAFDEQSAKFLVKCNLDFYKIASSELTNFKLIDIFSKTKKPLFLSTGMSDLKDVENAIGICRKNNNEKIVLMQCSALYPTPPKHANILVLQTYKKFNYFLGFSDHTLDNVSAILSIGLNSIFFEKHITLNKNSKGPDHFYALEPNEFKKYILDLNNAKQALGSKKKNMLPLEKKFCRREGIYLKKSIKKGQILKRNFVLIKRPSLGIRARDLEIYLNKKIKLSLKKNEALFEKYF